MRTKKRVDVRKFINLKGFNTSAYVMARVDDTSSSADDRQWCYMSLKIADCNRIIDLDFDVDTKEELKNSLYKIDTLINTFTQFREALLAEGELARIRREVREKAKRLNPS